MRDDKKQSEEKCGPAYLKYISSSVSDELYERIIRILHIEKKYRDKHYSAKKMLQNWEPIHVMYQLC